MTMGAGSAKPKDETTQEGQPQNTTGENITTSLKNPQKVLEPVTRETPPSTEWKSKQDSCIQDDATDIVESELLELENNTDVLELDRGETLNEQGVIPPKALIKKKKKSVDGGRKPAAWKMSKSQEKQTVNRFDNDGKTMERFQQKLLEYELEGEDITSTVLKQGGDKTNYHTKQTNDQNQGNENEKFDPSKIIDVSKFKEANAPQNKSNVPQKLSGHSTNEGPMSPNNDENTQNTEETNKNIKNTSGLDKRISRKVIYNEEEEILMASIEKEFLSEDNLPGSVFSV